MSIAVYHHSHTLYIAYLTRYDLFWQSVFRYAVAQYATTLLLHLEYLNSESHTGKVAGNRYTSRTRTYHRHFATVFLCYILMRKMILCIEIGNEAFQLANIDMLSFLS